MPPQPGEVSLLTLFADVHYYFSPPTATPSHHRFDKASYVYLYQNPIQHTGRVEVANHAGTPRQDAFMGQLDSVRVQRTYKQPNLFTITVDGPRQQNGGATPAPQPDHSQWHLPGLDLRNESSFYYRLHTIDIYFWTTADSSMFLDSLRRVVRGDQLQIEEDPAAQSDHRDPMSPVVQKLEQAAISKPFQGRSDSISTTQSYNGPPTAVSPLNSTSVPPPPPQVAEAPGSFAPMAYNPAAPAAPEPFSQRVPTPPPPDAADGTGLATAAMHDQSNPHGPPPMQQHYQQQYHAGPPHAQQPGSMAPPPAPSTAQGPVPGVQRTSTAISLSQAPQSPPPGQPQIQSFAPPPQDPNAQPYGALPTPPHSLHQQHGGQQMAPYTNYPQSPGTPSLQQHSHPSTPGPAQMQSSGMPPPGGYSQYNYGPNQQSQNPNSSEAYNVHNTVYRPTESEASSHHGKPPTAGPGQQAGRLEGHAGKIEKGVGRFLKKLDKKF